MKTYYFVLAFCSIILTEAAYPQNYWEPTDGIEGRQVRSIATGHGSNMYAATLDSGIYRSTDNGTTWHRSSSGLNNRITWSVVTDPYSAVKVYACTDGSGIFRSTDSGETWEPTGLTEHRAISMVVNPLGNMFVATLDTSILRSSDDGITWQQIGNADEVGSDVYSLVIDKSGNIYAGTDSRIFRSTDNGTNWDRCDSGYVNISGAVWSFAVTSPGDILIGEGGGFFRGPGSIYQTSDNGDTWNQLQMTNRSVLALVLNSEGHIFAGTDSGVVFSVNNGDSGTRINSGLTSLVVISLALDSSGYIYAGTFGGGVFRSAHPTTSVYSPLVSMPQIFRLHQNYPNPFNPSTTIQFDIPKASFVTLTVYDVLGQEVATLVNEKRELGRYEVSFDGSKLTNGVYFYRLRADHYTNTKQLLLLK